MNELEWDRHIESQRQAWEIQDPKRCYDCYFYSAFEGQDYVVCRERWREISSKRVACRKFIEEGINGRMDRD